MAFATELQAMAQHLEKWLTVAMPGITDTDGNQAFKKVVYGEPRIVTVWPTLSVQPQRRTRELKATRTFELIFYIDLVLYHGQVTDTLAIQEKTHKRIEAIDAWVLADLQWNFDDTDDVSKDKVIFGFPTVLDHPIIIAPENELWSASRIRLEGQSQETF